MSHYGRLGALAVPATGVVGWSLARPHVAPARFDPSPDAVLHRPPAEVRIWLEAAAARLAADLACGDRVPSTLRRQGARVLLGALARIGGPEPLPDL